MIHEKVKNIKWKKDEDGIEFETIEIPLRHDMTARLEVWFELDYDRLIARQDSAWVFIDYKGEEYDLTEYEISEGYPYQEEYTETSNSKLPRHRDGDYHSSWFKKLEANLDYLTKKANEAFGF
jgi:hypothetical protein